MTNTEHALALAMDALQDYEAERDTHVDAYWAGYLGEALRQVAVYLQEA